jgi:hypothetical protein
MFLFVIPMFTWRDWWKLQSGWQNMASIWIYLIISCGHPTRGGIPARGLGMGLTTPQHIKQFCYRMLQKTFMVCNLLCVMQKMYNGTVYTTRPRFWGKIPSHSYPTSQLSLLQWNNQQHIYGYVAVTKA